MCVHSAFVVYVRPILEYNNVVWSPWLKQDIDQIEKVQRRLTKRLVGMKDLNTDERMHQLGLPSLELRHLHLDLIFCYKVVFGLVGVNIDFFEFNHAANTRGHAYKLFKSRSVNNIRIFFAERIVNVWNGLPPSVSFASLSTFRRTIQKVDFSQFMKCT